MTSLESKNEMLVMALTDLAAICKKLSENPALTEDMRVKARQFVEQFNSLLPYRGKGTPVQHAQGETLLIQIARFLPSVVEVSAVRGAA